MVPHRLTPLRNVTLRRLTSILQSQSQSFSALAASQARLRLLVSSSPPVRKLISALLAKSGYLVLQAGSAAEALQLTREHAQPIDLVLSDVVLPDLSGPALVSELERISPDTRFLYTSGHSPEVLRRYNIPPASPDLLRKPFSGRELLIRVRGVLDAKNDAVA